MSKPGSLNALIRDKKLQDAADARMRERRLEMRRGYDRAGRERRRARALAETGIHDLPLETQATIQSLEAQAPAPEEVPKPADATVAELVDRLTRIKDH